MSDDKTTSEHYYGYRKGTVKVTNSHQDAQHENADLRKIKAA